MLSLSQFATMLYRTNSIIMLSYSDLDYPLEVSLSDEKIF